MEEKFIDRLQKFMETEGINDNQMTVRANLSIGLVGRCRKERKGMASDSIEKILSAYPELSAEWLFRGEGEMLRTTGWMPNSEKHSGGVVVSGNGAGVDVANNVPNVVNRFLSIIEEKDRQIAQLIVKL